MKKLCWRILAVVFWLLLWQTAAMAVNQRILLVSPLETLQALFSLLPNRRLLSERGGLPFAHSGGFFRGTCAGGGPGRPGENLHAAAGNAVSRDVGR